MAFVLFLNTFLFQPFTANVEVFKYAAYFFFILGIFWNKEYLRKNWKILTLLGGLVLFATVVTIGRANGFIRFLMIFAQIKISILATYLLAGEIPFVRSLMEVAMAPLRLFAGYIRGGVAFGRMILAGNLLKSSSASGWRSSLSLLGRGRSVFIGLVIAVPLILVLVGLLGGGDPIFGSYVGNIGKWLEKLFTAHLWNEITARGIFSLIIFIFLTPYLTLKLRKNFSSPLAFLAGYHFITEATVVMALTAAVLGAFLIIQWPYVFASVPFETNLSRFGVKTYSEYVNRGFTELLVAALYIYSLIWGGLILFRDKAENTGRWISKIQLVILGEFAIFLLSIGRRIYLYQSYHGWSLVRIYGSILLVWIACMAVTLMARHLPKKRNWVKLEVAFSIFILVFLGLFNAEDFIVKNHPPTVNKRVDLVYLSRLSEDGYEGWVRAFEQAKRVLTNPEFDKSDHRNREERREIAYAGTIVHALSRNYHNLILNYGTNEAIILYLQTMLEGEINVRSMYKDVKRRDVRTDGEEIAYRNRINENLRLLYNKDKDWPKIIRKINTGGWSPVVSFDLDNLEFPTFYYFALEENAWYSEFERLPSEKSRWTNLLTFNKTRHDVFQKMESEIGYRNLSMLQMKFYQLKKKIALQQTTLEDKDKDYDSDISFDTPFLQGL